MRTELNPSHNPIIRQVKSSQTILYWITALFTTLHINTSIWAAEPVPTVEYQREVTRDYSCSTDSTILDPDPFCNSNTVKEKNTYKFFLQRFFLKSKEYILNYYKITPVKINERKIKDSEYSSLIITPNDNDFFTKSLGVYLLNKDGICIGYSLNEGAPSSFEDATQDEEFQLIKSLPNNPSYLQGKLPSLKTLRANTYEQHSSGYIERYVTITRPNFGETPESDAFFPTSLSAYFESEFIQLLDYNIKQFEIYESEKSNFPH